jgi:beta-lactamase regulating signal transducer with metallopeptidase domain
MADTVIRILAQVLAHSIWQGAVVMLVAMAALALAGQASPSVRFRILATALVAHLLAPLATAIVLVVRYVPGRDGAIAAQSATSGAAAAAAAPSIPSINAPFAEGSAVIERGLDGLGVDRVATFIVALWLCGVLLAASRYAGGWMTIRRLVHSALPADEALELRVRALIERMGIGRQVRVVVSKLIEIPFTFGWLRPVVVIPISMLASLDPRYVDAIIAHELAHVRRLDYVVGVLQSVAMTLLYHHPATWWLDRRLRAEREYCADDVAATVARDRILYIRALAELESARLGLSSLALAANDGSLVARVERLTGAAPRAQSHGLAAVGALAALLGSAVVVRAADVLPPSITPAVAIASTARTVTATPASIETLAARWQRAMTAAARQRDGAVLGWYVRSDVTRGSAVVSGTDGRSREGGPSVAQAARIPASERGVAVLVTVSDGRVDEVRIRSLDTSIPGDDPPLEWLGAATDGESIAQLERLMGEVRSGSLRSELAAALSVHDDLPRVTRAVERVLESDRDDQVRAEAVAWFGRRPTTPAVLGLLDRAVRDRAFEVRDEALTALFSKRPIDGDYMRGLARTSEWRDVREEISDRLDRAGTGGRR